MIEQVISVYMGTHRGKVVLTEDGVYRWAHHGFRTELREPITPVVAAAYGVDVQPGYDAKRQEAAHAVYLEARITETHERWAREDAKRREAAKGPRR